MAAIDDINQAIDTLSVLLDSDAYMKMLNDPNTSAQDEDLLKEAFQLRSELVQTLLAIYAKRISENTTEFKDLVGKMSDVDKAASDAASNLNTYTDRVKAAVQVASYLDTALEYAAKLAA